MSELIKAPPTPDDVKVEYVEVAGRSLYRGTLGPVSAYGETVEEAERKCIEAAAFYANGAWG
jgi:hypothetical protein